MYIGIRVPYHFNILKRQLQRWSQSTPLLWNNVSHPLSRNVCLKYPYCLKSGDPPVLHLPPIWSLFVQLLLLWYTRVETWSCLSPAINIRISITQFDVLLLLNQQNVDCGLKSRRQEWGWRGRFQDISAQITSHRISRNGGRYDKMAEIWRHSLLPVLITKTDKATGKTPLCQDKILKIGIILNRRGDHGMVNWMRDHGIYFNQIGVFEE